MDQYFPHLKLIDKEKDFLMSTLETWANIHSGSDNLQGLKEMLHTLQAAFAPLGGEQKVLSLPPRKILNKGGSYTNVNLGQALMISKHPQAPIKVLLVGHMDIAYPANLPLEKCQISTKDIMIGRGTADMKGGLLIALTALNALEKSPFSEKIGWQVIINPDEEIGSPGSASILETEAIKHDLGLVFEPALPDGTLVSARKGSANFTITAKGRAAHAGRDFFNGINALISTSRFALGIESLTDIKEEVTVNVGYLEGGGPVNIVPDQAICRLNVRVKKIEDLAMFKEKIHHIAEIENRRTGVEFLIHQDSERPPKIFDKKTRNLFESLKECGNNLGLHINWKNGGGVCDGNTLAAAGLSTIDTLGAIGGNLHTSEEYVSIGSLLQRSKLAARFLMQIAAGEIMLK